MKDQQIKDAKTQAVEQLRQEVETGRRLVERKRRKLEHLISMDGDYMLIYTARQELATSEEALADDVAKLKRLARK